MATTVPRPSGDRPGPLHGPGDTREESALEAARQAGRASDLDTAGAGIWRTGSAVLVGLPVVPALARVDGPERFDDAARQVAVARALSACAVPALRPVGTAAQPVVVDDGVVTLWAWEPPGRALSSHDIGVVARNLHDRTRRVGPDEVPAHDPLAATAAELDRAGRAGTTATGDLDLLGEVLSRLAAAWPDPAEDPLGTGVVHGDLHRHNVLGARRGAVLVDLELAGRGPASADVAPQVVAERRYAGAAEDLEAFLDGYGADPRGWAGFEVLVEAYELWVTVWAVANRAGNAAADHEAELRLRYWRTGSSGPWSLR